MKSFKQFMEAKATSANNYGIPDGSTLADLDKIYNTTSNPEKKERAHWLRNMRRGQQAKKEGYMPEGSGKPESWEAGYKRRVVKTTKPEHKEKGYNWRIKGKDRPEISIKLYKEKPDQAEFNRQMKRVAGHEFGG